MDKYTDLRDVVESDGGLHTTTMNTLKQLQRAGRLGVNVRQSISRALASHGLGHLPQDLPANQEDTVRIYLFGTPIADTIDAVLKPSEKGDETLRSVGASEAQEQLRQIREIVCG